MISYQTWKPDTCDCVIEESHDPQGDKDKPQHLKYGVQFSKVIKRCEIHKSVPLDELWGVIYANPDGENKRKNQFLRILLGYEDVKGLGLEELKKNQDGSDAGLGLKDGIEYSWSFEGEGKNRVLKAEIKGANLSKAQKDTIKDLCKNKFGDGKVEVV